MTETVRRKVRERAIRRCEYCQLHQEESPLAPLHVEQTAVGRTTLRVLELNGDDRLDLRRA